MRGYLVGLVLAMQVFAGGVQAKDGNIPCEDGKRYYTLGRQAGASQDFAKAAQWLEKSVAACDSYLAWHLLGTANQKQRKLKESLSAYEQAVLNATSQTQVALSTARYGQVMALNGQRFEALTMLEQAIEIHPSPPSWMLENARELDLSLAQSPINSESIKRSLSSQEFGLLAMSQIEDKAGSERTGKAVVRIPINYKLDSVEMDNLTADNIEELGKVLASKAYEDKTFTLIGHSDVRGSWNHNLDLSEQRADAAKKALVEEFPSLTNRLRIVGAGEAKPKYPGEDLPESEHRLNRRLEVIVN